MTTALIPAFAETALPITGSTTAFGNTAACDWCDALLTGSGRGSRQRFCSSACRTAFHSAARRRAESDVAAGIITVADLRNGPTEACTLSGRTEQGPPVGGVGREENALYDRPMRFLVEVPPSTVDGLILLGLLGPAQREDLLAILAAAKRLGRQPDVCRID